MGHMDLFKNHLYLIGRHPQRSFVFDTTANTNNILYLIGPYPQKLLYLIGQYPRKSFDRTVSTKNFSLDCIHKILI